MGPYAHKVERAVLMIVAEKKKKSAPKVEKGTVTLVVVMTFGIDSPPLLFLCID
jgi:hypothetical protein